MKTKYRLCKDDITPFENATVNTGCDGNGSWAISDYSKAKLSMSSYSVAYDPDAPIKPEGCLSMGTLSLQDSTPMFFRINVGTGKAIVTFTQDKIIVDPDCKVEEAAQAVLDLVLQGIINNETIRKAKAYDLIKEREKNFKIEPTPLTPEEIEILDQELE